LPGSPYIRRNRQKPISSSQNSLRLPTNMVAEALVFMDYKRSLASSCQFLQHDARVTNIRVCHYLDGTAKSRFRHPKTHSGSPITRGRRALDAGVILQRLSPPQPAHQTDTNSAKQNRTGGGDSSNTDTGTRCPITAIIWIWAD